MREYKYILDEKGKPKIEPDVRKWAAWFESAKADKKRIVKQTQVGEEFVSTVFLGLDHDFAERGIPLLYETMVFWGETSGHEERYATREEAVKGHAKVVKQRRQEAKTKKLPLRAIIQANEKNDS